MVNLNIDGFVRHEYASGDETSLEGFDNDSKQGLFINNGEEDIVEITNPSVKVGTSTSQTPPAMDGQQMRKKEW